MRNSVEEFPLTKKWTPIVNKIAREKGIPVNELLQEARIWEWELSQKILDLKYRENYFKKSIYKCIVGHYYQANGLGYSWWSKNKVVGDKRERDILASIIVMRSFDELYYDDLVRHITDILRQANKVLAEMFRLRVEMGLRWKEIRKRFLDVGHNRFYGMVKSIKRVVEKEVR